MTFAIDFAHMLNEKFQNEPYFEGMRVKNGFKHDLIISQVNGTSETIALIEKRTGDVYKPSGVAAEYSFADTLKAVDDIGIKGFKA